MTSAINTGAMFYQLSHGETWKTLNNNDHNQVFWARETEHPQQTIVLTKTAGQLSLSKVFLWTYSNDIFFDCTWSHGGHFGGKNNSEIMQNLSYIFLLFCHQHGRLITRVQSKNTFISFNTDIGMIFFDSAYERKEKTNKPPFLTSRSVLLVSIVIVYKSRGGVHCVSGRSFTCAWGCSRPSCCNGIGFVVTIQFLDVDSFIWPTFSFNWTVMCRRRNYEFWTFSWRSNFNQTAPKNMGKGIWRKLISLSSCNTQWLGKAPILKWSTFSYCSAYLQLWAPSNDYITASAFGIQRSAKYRFGSNRTRTAMLPCHVGWRQ